MTTWLHPGLFVLLAAALGGLMPVQAVASEVELMGSNGPKQMTALLPIDDVELAYQVFGAPSPATPLVMIMGYGGLMEMWPPTIIETLARERQVIVFDHRGMGHSSSSDQAYSIARFAADTHALLQALGVERAQVLGWSMGSFVAQELALQHPEQVTKLVLLSGSCGGPSAIWPDPEVWARLLDLSGTLEVRVQRMFENLFPPAWLAITLDPLQVFPPITAPIEDAHLRRQGETLRAWPGVCDRLAEISAETLLMTGTDDIVIPSANSRLMAERIQGASLIQLHGGGHGFFYQEPERTARLLGAFLAGE